ncbi:ABC transporter permease [Propioniciclava soli]|uniref:ABC transporter permease n=1 Tax=Propioniciclava soli TaxID=2775081 RepID=UPI001E497A20
MTVDLGPGLVLALALLLALAVAASLVGRLGIAREQVVAAVRAVAQLAAVSLVVAAAVQTLVGGIAFAALMFTIAVWTTTGRVGVRDCWPFTALALLAGVLPVLGLVLVSGATPVNGTTVVALGGIVIGNMMTAHTLTGRRLFAELRDQRGIYEAGLALGLQRHEAIGEVIDPVTAEGLVPNLDQTKTVGLVTLPGAFIGVLLGGGSPLQAGAAQVLVLVAIMAGQACTVTTLTWLIARGRVVPADLRSTLHA